jgi:hypothetical protein
VFAYQEAASKFGEANLVEANLVDVTFSEFQILGSRSLPLRDLFAELDRRAG